MPSLIKRRGSAVWCIRYRDNGQDRLTTTGETDYRRATQLLKAAKAEVRVSRAADRTVDSRMGDLIAQLRRMPEKHREESRLRLIGLLEELAVRRLPLADAWAAWLAVPKQTGTTTLTGYAAVWNRFLSWLKSHRPAVDHLSQIGEADARWRVCV